MGERREFKRTDEAGIEKASVIVKEISAVPDKLLALHQDSRKGTLRKPQLVTYSLKMQIHLNEESLNPER